MTLRLNCILAVALVSAVPAALAQQSSGSPSLDRPRSAYDPAAKSGAAASHKSAIDTALHAVNPQDKDYGEVISQGRLAAIEDTFQNFLWWADVVLATGFVLSLAGNVFQQRRSEDRLRISASIVAQLFNAHSASHAKAFEAIEKHNRVADLYNAKCDELAAQQAAAAAAEQKRVKKGANKDASRVAEQQTPEEQAPVGTAAVRGERVEQGEPESSPQADPNISDAEERRILKAQLVARDQKISNLRTQLNRASQSLEEERRRTAATTQA